MKNKLKESPCFKEAILALVQPKTNIEIHPEMLRARTRLAEEAWDLDIRLAQDAIMHNVAPTGSGKTISSALYGARVAYAENLNRIVFTTPLILLTDQAEEVLKHQLEETALQVKKTHSKMAYASASERKKARGLKFDISICTTQKLHLALLNYKQHKEARKNLEKSVIIIDDAALWLKPEYAAAILIQLDKLRAAGSRIILSSASLPYYDEIPGYLPKGIRFHRFGEGISRMPGMKNRCKLETHTRPVGLEHLVKMVKENPKPNLIICETVQKCSHVFNALRTELPKDKIFMVNAKQAKYKRREEITAIERALKSKDAHKVIVVSTSTTHAGWDVSFANGINDTFEVITALEQAGRINRAMEFGEKCKLQCMQIQIPGVPRNTNVDTSRAIAMTIMEKGMLTNPRATTIAAEMELNDRGKEKLKKAKKNAIASQKDDFKYLRANVFTMQNNGTKGSRVTLPPDKFIPQLYVRLKKLLESLGLRVQILKGSRIQIEEKISHEQIEHILTHSEEIFEEYTIEISDAKLNKMQEKGDVLRRIVFNLPNGETVETDYYMLTPEAFDPDTGMPK